MARATRSAAQLQEKDKQPDSTTTARGKSATKKRKRTSLAGTDDQPPTKHHRSENGIKEEQHLDDEEKLTTVKLPHLELAGDVPIDSSDAQKILDILELVDSQGLLDRVFPLPSSDLSGPSTSKSQAGTFSLRTLLRESSQHPLRVLRAAVKNLSPISYQPRVAASTIATQQLRFCNLVWSLLDQASFHSVPLPLDIETILNDLPESHADSEAKPVPGSPHPDRPSHSHQTRKYALMQRLPSGTWWTSLNSDVVPSDEKSIKDLSTANAELVAVLPSPSTSVQPESSTPSTLGSYVPKKPPGYRAKLPGPRRVSCGAFLDYGPYASFAPVFEQEGMEVGRSTLGEVYGQWENRKKAWSEKGQALMDSSSSAGDTSTVNGAEPSPENVAIEDVITWDGLFPPEQVRLLKEALDNLELEAAVQELLERNSKALERLEQLQNQRLMKPGGFSPVVEGSEEWDIAQGIVESLAVLASLRPRSSTSDTAPLVPSTSTLHKLQRTLPTTPIHSWQGTLPAGRTTALRDNSTLYIKSTATTIPSNPPPAPTPAAAPSQPTPAATAGTTTAPTQPYTGYSYNYATPYRTGYQYKPGQATSYYPNAYAQATSQTPTTGQYYANQQYSTAGQQQYAYSWYQYNPQAQATAAGGTSGRGTPQPSTTGATPTTIPTSYASFFSANAQTSGQRAVANTVLATAAAAGSAKPYQPAAGGTWSAGAGATGYVAPTLPPHMKSAVGAAQTGAAVPYSGGVYQPGYYGAYQATPSSAQS